MDGAVGISRDDTSAVDSVLACRCRKLRRVSADNAVSVLVLVQPIRLQPRLLLWLLLMRLHLPLPIGDEHDCGCCGGGGDDAAGRITRIDAGAANPSAGDKSTGSTDRAATRAASAGSFGPLLAYMLYVAVIVLV
mmetsp:Transcript_33978/g.74736  ORF Transcript_33978/g.74736 Transcript_33978/m.74736 type:complete len:135 (-) Transcript_33978:71-475(-)|eukprot:CAMPEP_0178642252 /NCGR_PEP_ID=MMETSP0698-20121128/17052_1 /TAXON_ID=265572 /ORGANISM="Extubocellulus spinifer, Strain CCMP396" /LENGTH=134 /DNA_ID=CAMNT_0020282949 /DNA_START=337 /DNA_END=741 /DNA_ORIENTATION=+